ncbi:hypothetical protein HDU98_000092 [Podochytrium sp. JEL0797]|nr:hypothetical protein HDU98_000092 [Podochytrium sp. JEL0797]
MSHHAQQDRTDAHLPATLQETETLLPSKRSADTPLSVSQKKTHFPATSSLSGLDGPFLFEFEADLPLPRVDSKLEDDEAADVAFQVPAQLVNTAPYSPTPFAPSLETLNEEDQTVDLLDAPPCLTSKNNLADAQHPHILPPRLTSLLSHAKPLLHRALHESTLLQQNHAVLLKVVKSMCVLTIAPVAVWMVFVSFPVWVGLFMVFGYARMKEGVVGLGREVKACLEV